MTTELATTVEQPNILAVIAKAAADPAVDVHKMERLLEMYYQQRALDAEEAFNKAMRKCQAEMSPIAADAENKQTRSKYAKYDKLDRALRPIYTSNGFSLSFDSGEQAGDYLLVKCYVSHEAGHTRTHQLPVPNDGKGAKGGDVMTKTHAQGSAMSYGMRYLLKAIFNVAIGEEDNDGNGAEESADAAAPWIEKVQACETIDALKAVGDEMKKADPPGPVMVRLRQAWAARKRTLEQANAAAD